MTFSLHEASVGKFRARPDIASWFERSLADQRFGGLPIDRPHLDRLARLPLIHRDPFDRLLIAQAQTERLVLVTPDARRSGYDVDTMW